jgi:glutaredoxin
MLNLQDLQKLSTSDNLLLYKPGCPFCKATEELFEKLIELGIVSGFTVKYLGDDFDNETLLELVSGYGWEPKSEGQFPSKPQIFINQGGKSEHFAGNDKFYQSRWNLGDNESGEISLNGAVYKTPKLGNPRG